MLVLADLLFLAEPQAAGDESDDDLEVVDANEAEARTPAGGTKRKREADPQVPDLPSGKRAGTIVLD